MTMWVPNLESRRGPCYLAIVDAIGEAIESGALVDGDRLLPQREFAYRLGVNLGTVSRAFSLAQKRGLLRGEVGRGSYVRVSRADQSGLDFRPRTASDLVDLSCFLPSGAGIMDTVRQVLLDIAEDADVAAFNVYPPGRGLRRHRIAGVQWVARLGFQAEMDDVIVCPSAQQALAATLGTLTNPGDTIFAESLTYSGIKQLAHLFHLRVEGIAMDEEGMLPEALEAACRTSAARVLYVQPSIHNPTTAVMGEPRRARIADIARKHDLTVIEDATCAMLLDPKPTPLVAMIPERTCFVAGTSKALSPSLRTAFLRTPQDLCPRIFTTLNSLNISTPTLAAEVVARLILDANVDAVLKSTASDLAERHRLVDAILGDQDIRHHRAAPYGWIVLPTTWRADDLLSAAKAHGLAVVTAEKFAVGRINAPHDIRISVGHGPRHANYRKGLEILAGLLSRTPQPQDPVV